MYKRNVYFLNESVEKKPAFVSEDMKGNINSKVFIKNLIYFRIHDKKTTLWKCFLTRFILLFGLNLILQEACVL